MDNNDKLSKLLLIVIIVLILITISVKLYKNYYPNKPNPIIAVKEYANLKRITIESVDEYIDFINNCDQYNNYENVTINLLADLDFEGDEDNLTPIFSKEFKGVFNGNGHSLNNVYIMGGQSGYAALFSKNSGTIKKLTVTGTVVSSHGAAAFVGQNYGTILQCVNYAEIQGAYDVGGICAWCGNPDEYGTILYCVNHGRIIDTEPGCGGTIGYGGIVGFLYNGNVSYCYSIGDIPKEGYHQHSTSNISGWFYNDEKHATENCFYLSSNEVNKDSEYFNPTTSITSDVVLKSLNTNIKAFKLDEKDEYPVLDMTIDIK